ncbi:hypothetical protein DNU06_03550 [Putridiphycobacter roseus]|uniref:Gliding motility-associated C-terminal domain-containing protein n=1 Tax=Putridiphycobacter roseus TaxID=2219161 RepID=A0A2W1NHB0_9FLAO|nr:gliding motility-associated C-terminal domain-containing protein [Putridiphycobacter roseus]PZE18915.1 hypothetical protein DNU06_03550 [Putridiphycobacter roseus]
MHLFTIIGISFLCINTTIVNATEINSKPKASPCNTIKTSTFINHTDTDSSLFVLEDPSSLFIPNAFTPWSYNGKNNTFKVIGKEIDQFEMIIYNRSGEIVFKSYNPDKEWDGKYASRYCSPGVYLYQIKYISNYGSKKSRQGFVTIL